MNVNNMLSNIEMNRAQIQGVPLGLVQNFKKAIVAMQNELYCGKNPISKVCLGGSTICTITSKTKINAFGNFVFTLGLLREPST